MLVLALDTSTLQSAVGWICTTDNSAQASVEAFAELSAPARPGHAETLLGRIEAVLAWGGYCPGDVDLIVFGRGPGTFTGVRIGLSTVKGLTLGLGIPALGISSLEGVAFSAGVQGRVAALIDARRGELFGAVYDVRMENTLPVATAVMNECVMPAKEIVKKIASVCGDTRISIAGNGVSPYKELLIEHLARHAEFLPVQSSAPSAFWLARVGRERFFKQGPDDMDMIEPVYLREPDARLPAPR